MREIVHLQAGQCGNQIGAKVASMCPALCSWTWSRAPWTLCARGLSGRSSGRTTLSSVRAVPGTTGPRDTTRKGRSSSTRCWMS
uniref:Tubulin beta 4B class IVb n=1 Tax=Ovis aries TaxID=9940 RepID=A0AC11CE34_SHEEP